MRGGEVVVDGFAAKRLEPFGVNESVSNNQRSIRKIRREIFFFFSSFSSFLK